MSSLVINLLSGFLLVAFVMSAVYLGYQFVYLSQSGRQLSKDKRLSTNNLGNLRAIHKQASTKVLLAMLVAVVFLELFFYSQDLRYTDQVLFFVHLGLVISFVLLFLLIKFIFNGHKNPDWHKRLVYPCQVLFLAVIVTGFILFIG